jgi:microcystin-dependent protein
MRAAVWGPYHLASEEDDTGALSVQILPLFVEKDKMHGNALAPAGGNQPHHNRMPDLTLNFCIALQGVYPPRT